MVHRTVEHGKADMFRMLHFLKRTFAMLRIERIIRFHRYRFDKP